MHDAAQVFVYYRVKAEDADQVIAAVRTMQRELCAAVPGLRCSLGQREEIAETEWLTLMETYSSDAQDSPAWRNTVEALAAQRLQHWIDGERHIETFLPCA